MRFVVLLLNIVINTYGFYVTLLSLHNSSQEFSSLAVLGFFTSIKCVIISET